MTLDDGVRLEPDAVICATGYRCGLEPLVGHLGVLDKRGVPAAVGERAAAPGLRFIGYVPRPGGLGYMGKEAKGGEGDCSGTPDRASCPSRRSPRQSRVLKTNTIAAIAITTDQTVTAACWPTE